MGLSSDQDDLIAAGSASLPFRTHLLRTLPEFSCFPPLQEHDFAIAFQILVGREGLCDRVSLLQGL